MKPLRFLREARVEYVEALEHIEAARPGHGKKFEVEVATVLEQAAAFPGSARRLPGFPPTVNLRAFQLNKFRYALIVHVEEDEATVIAVAHQLRNPDYWSDRIG